MKESTTMQDGKEAWLTQSKNYYCRKEPYPEWKEIIYYDLEVS